MAKKLSDAKLCEEGAFLDVVAGDPEGRLFPDTYWFRTDATIEDILDTFNQRFEQALKELSGAPMAEGQAASRVLRRF